jgi:hypothetical protein
MLVYIYWLYNLYNVYNLLKRYLAHILLWPDWKCAVLCCAVLCCAVCAAPSISFNVEAPQIEIGIIACDGFTHSLQMAFYIFLIEIPYQIVY